MTAKVLPDSGLPVGTARTVGRAGARARRPLHAGSSPARTHKAGLYEPASLDNWHATLDTVRLKIRLHQFTICRAHQTGAGAC